MIDTQGGGSVGLPGVLGRRMQLGMVVKDLEATATWWAEELGVGPWIVIEGGGGDRRFVHRGQVTPVETSIAFSYAGDTQIEMISQTNDVPSPYLEFFESGREGLHHLGFWPDDFEASCRALERSGFAELCSVYLGDGTRNVTYYTSPPLVGIIVEVAPMTPMRQAYMSAIEKLARGWDGTRPLRRFPSRPAFLAAPDVADAEA